MTLQTRREPALTAPATSRPRFRRRFLAADLLAAACWASVAAAVAMFLASGGVHQFSSAASAVTSVGIVAGLIGSDLVLVMLVLAARLPFIDRTVGHDKAMATHRLLGKPALYFLLAHGLLILTGYGMTEGISPLAEIGSLWSVPDMPLAFIAIGLFVAVVVTSLVAVRRRFPYEVWHVVHLLSYAAVLTALPHQLSVGSVFAEGTAERIYWIALYAVALGSIGVFRFAIPAIRSVRHRVTVARIETIAPGVFSIHLEGRNLTALRSAGGQFLVWRFWTGATWWHAHPISLSAVPTSTSMRITVRELGEGTGRLSTLPIGTRVSFEGPYGLFTAAARTSPRLAIVAAGIGITPVRALLEQSALGAGEATVLLRGSSEAELYLLPEIENLATATHAHIYTSIGPRGDTARPWLSARDYERGVTLRTVFPHLRDSDLYVCGPLAWATSVEAEAKQSGMPAHQIHIERFDL